VADFSRNEICNINVCSRMNDKHWSHCVCICHQFFQHILYIFFLLTFTCDPVVSVKLGCWDLEFI
jgi:hypothetical protein